MTVRMSLRVLRLTVGVILLSACMTTLLPHILCRDSFVLVINHIEGINLFASFFDRQVRRLAQQIQNLS